MSRRRPRWPARWPPGWATIPRRALRRPDGVVTRAVQGARPGAGLAPARTLTALRARRGSPIGLGKGTSPEAATPAAQAARPRGAPPARRRSARRRPARPAGRSGPPPRRAACGRRRWRARRRAAGRGPRARRRRSHSSSLQPAVVPEHLGRDPLGARRQQVRLDPADPAARSAATCPSPRCSRNVVQACHASPSPPVPSAGAMTGHSERFAAAITLPAPPQPADGPPQQGQGAHQRRSGPRRCRPRSSASAAAMARTGTASPAPHVPAPRNRPGHHGRVEVGEGGRHRAGADPAERGGAGGEVAGQKPRSPASRRAARHPGAK